MYSMSVLLGLFFINTCATFFHQDIGIAIVGGDLSISTFIMRYLTMKPICPPGPPCHIYTSLSEEAISQVFINVHTNINCD